jgi:hypothetical protein
MKLLCLILTSCSLAAADTNSFHAFDSYEQLIEGGTVHTLVVDAGREHLVTRVPRNYAATVENGTQSVVFNEATGSIVIAMRVTTNWPGVMPGDDALRASALAANPGGAVLQVAGCATGYQPARFVDTTRVLDSLRTLRTRHAFVACPEGIVEFMFTAREPDFDKGRVVFNLFLSSFRVEIIQVNSGAPPPGRARMALPSGMD